MFMIFCSYRAEEISAMILLEMVKFRQKGPVVAV